MAIFGSIACGRPELTLPQAAADQIPQAVSVQPSALTIGAARGHVRKQRNVAGFQIARELITVGQFRACIEAGACTSPALVEGACGTSDRGVDGRTFDLPTADSTPVTCVSGDQAATYCRWVGGRLPTVDEWLLAARGPEVHRFSWGDAPLSCDRHWRIAFGSKRGACCGGDCNTVSAMLPGSHQAGASPFGLQDVLATAGELAMGDPGSAWGACRSPGTTCVVKGDEPGAIDYVVPFTSEPYSISPAGFRCAWGSR
jgi:formylglycine-generating enzyme required for sulfatase activity